MSGFGNPRAPTRLAIAVVVVSSWMTASAHPAQQAVAPWQLFAGPRLNIHAPNSTGWTVSATGSSGMTFGREDAATGNTWVAEVFVVPIPPLEDFPDLRQFADEVVAERSPPPRYERLQASFESTAERSYPCVAARATLRDTQARAARGTDSLQLHLRALICVVPGEPRMLTQITFSQRGGAAVRGFENQAAAFITGVDLPGR